MALDSIQAESVYSNPGEEIRTLVLEIQSLNRRISSLSRALDDALDIAWSDDRRAEALDRATHFNEIIMETTAQAAKKGEYLELLSNSYAKFRN